jgi:hypothetical protein
MHVLHVTLCAEIGITFNKRKRIAVVFLGDAEWVLLGKSSNLAGQQSY